MVHGIYLSANNDKEGFRLPVNPPEVNESGGASGEEYTISGLGKVNVPKDADLEVYPLESYFPKNKTYYSETEHFEPQFYIDHIKRWIKEKMHIRYIFVDGSFTINELVTIEKFDYKESDGSGDVYFKLSLKKYVPFGPKKMTIVKKPVSKSTTGVAEKTVVVKKKAPQPQNSKVQPKTYSLIKGDSLWKVAQKHLGDGNRFGEIAKLNGIKASDYKKLPIGLKLKLPPK